MSSTFFSRPATHNLNQFARINDAYTLAGLTPPTYVEELKRTIYNAPTVQQEAASIAQEALNADDPAEFYESAIERIQRAQAAEVLKNAFSQNIQAALDSKANSYRATATADLMPTINKVTKALTAAAKKLPAGKPLDMTANIEHGTGAEYKAARDALVALSVYSALYVQGTPNDGISSALHAVLPIIELPTATVERIKPNVGIEVVTSNQAQLNHTMTIRRISSDLGTDTDGTLARIAAGHYEGATIAFADPTTLTERRRNAVNAFKRVTDTHASGGKVIAF